MQAEAARLLRFRDGDGGEERLFGRRRVRRIALQQDIAADAVERGVGPVLSRLIRKRQRSIDPRLGGFRVIPLGFQLGEPPLEERRKHLVSVAKVCRQGSRDSDTPVSRPPSRARAQFKCTSPYARASAIPCSRPKSTGTVAVRIAA